MVFCPITDLLMPLSAVVSSLDIQPRGPGFDSWAGWKKTGQLSLTGHTSAHPVVMGTWCKLGFVARFLGNSNFILALCPVLANKKSTTGS